MVVDGSRNDAAAWYYQEPSEAAAIVGLRAAAFKSRLHRGRMELRALLEPYLNLDAV